MSVILGTSPQVVTEAVGKPLVGSGGGTSVHADIKALETAVYSGVPDKVPTLTESVEAIWTVMTLPE